MLYDLVVSYLDQIDGMNAKQYFIWTSVLVLCRSRDRYLRIPGMCVLSGSHQANNRFRKIKTNSSSLKLCIAARQDYFTAIFYVKM